MTESITGPITRSAAGAGVPSGVAGPAAGTTAPVRIGADTLEWSVWSTTARVVVTDPDRLDDAHTVVSQVLAEVDAAASRFRTDSEINEVHRAQGRPVQVSPLLAELVRTALDAARDTDGDVDPTVGSALADLGYDRDLGELDRDVFRAADRSALTVGAGFTRITVRTAPNWQRVDLTDLTLTVPAGTVIDLGATAKAWAADRSAALVADLLGTGVLVSLGGDIATAGATPDGGWQIRVQDAPTEPGCDVALPSGGGIATSSTIRRQWRHGERAVHHILNPRTLEPAEPVWRTVTVAAATCVQANTLTTAAMVRGRAAFAWLNGLGVPARLVDHEGIVLGTRAWPEPAPSAARRPDDPALTRMTAHAEVTNDVGATDGTQRPDGTGRDRPGLPGTPAPGTDAPLDPSTATRMETPR